MMITGYKITTISSEAMKRGNIVDVSAHLVSPKLMDKAPLNSKDEASAAWQLIDRQSWVLSLENMPR